MFGKCEGIYIAYSSPPQYACDYKEYDENDNETKTELISGYYRRTRQKLFRLIPG